MMRSKYLLLMLFAGATCLTACSDDSKTPSGQGPIVEQDTNPTIPDAGTNPDANTPGNQDDDAKDPGVDPPDGVDQPDTEEPEECVPTLTECPADQCGEVDNGCGEMIQCEPCPCNDGIAAVEECGVCGLGTRSCGSGETGFGACSEPEILGLSDASDTRSCELKLIFADASASDGGDGSMSNPFSTYEAAAAAANAGQTIILLGSTPFSEPLIVKNGVSVMGGVTDGKWDSRSRAYFEVPAPQDSPVFGLKAENIDHETLVTNVRVETADAAQGQTNYGSYVFESEELRLRSVKIRAGNGGKGIDGVNGEPGATGNPGENAQDASIFEQGPEEAYFEIPKGGTNPECPSSSGGDGGQGWIQRPFGYGTVNAQNGQSTSGAQGGLAGWGELGKQGGGDADRAAPITSSGNNGDGGPSEGRVMNGLWEPRDVAINGTRGPHGHGGAGGGGAHGLDGTQAAPPGGGGGAGGCGGHPGTAGKPGGGSFGLFLIRSDIAVADSEFRAGPGGNGGNGGLGGRGGLAGRGGSGTTKNITENSYEHGWQTGVLAWSSGKGGDGSAGGEGGAGGGGAGGVSYGVYCSQSRFNTEGQVDTMSTGSSFGGTSAGNVGADGISKNREGCD